MLMVMAMSTMLACGDDDSDSKKVDGVNVINGKKIVELSITNIQPYYTIYEVIWDTPIATYKIEYDSEGRLKKILNKNIDIKEGNDGKKHSYYTGKYTEIVSIDYDMRFLSYKTNYNSFIFNFTLNNEGYIDQIGTSTLTYDNNWYLIGVENRQGISSLVYKSEDFIKATVSPLLKGKASLYYVTYGNTTDKGDLIIHGHYTSDPRDRLSFDNSSIAYFIAYQAGLFGKISKTIMNLKNGQKASAIIDYEDDYNTGDMRFSFVWQ